MITKFNECPNCGHRPSGLIFEGDWMKIYECEDCGTQYCHECSGSNNGKKCPECGSKDRSIVGECWSR